MVSKTLKYGLWTLASVLLAGAALIAIVMFVVNPDAYRVAASRWVERTTGRTLTIRGHARLAWFPAVGIELGRITLSDWHSSQAFASARRLRLSLSWPDLLHGRIAIDRIQVSGLRLALVRYADGQGNYADLLARHGGGASSIRIGGVAIADGEISFDDRASGRRFAIDHLRLDTGPLASGVSTPVRLAFRYLVARPATSPQVDAAGTLRFDSARQRYVLSALSLRAHGAFPPATVWRLAALGTFAWDGKRQRLSANALQAALDGTRGPVRALARLTASRLEWGAKGGEASAIVLHASGVAPGGRGTVALRLPDVRLRGRRASAAAMRLDVAATDASGALKGRMTGGLGFDWGRGQLALPHFVGEWALTSPRLKTGRLSAEVAGQAQADWARERASAALTGRVGNSRAVLTVAARGLPSPAYTFDAELDRLDVDRYLAPSNKPFDFARIQQLPFTGTIHIGTLRMGATSARDVRIAVIHTGQSR
ncbi:MAG: AsmA family protein [Betaproteobacteria bacterium]|nr:AsmA family protein [Betaproteobacteria bacterium]